MKKKNALPRPSNRPGRTIGPPMRPPLVRFVSCGIGSPFNPLKNVLLLNILCWM